MTATGKGEALWIRSPLAVLCDADAGGGLVVAGGRIVELVPAGAEPETPGKQTTESGLTGPPGSSGSPSQPVSHMKKPSGEFLTR